MYPKALESPPGTAYGPESPPDGPVGAAPPAPTTIVYGPGLTETPVIVLAPPAPPPPALSHPPDPPPATMNTSTSPDPESTLNVAGPGVVNSCTVYPPTSGLLVSPPVADKGILPPGPSDGAPLYETG